MTGPLFACMSPMTLAPRLTVSTVTMTRNPESAPSGVAMVVGRVNIAAVRSVSMKRFMKAGKV